MKEITEEFSEERIRDNNNRIIINGEYIDIPHDIYKKLCKFNRYYSTNKIGEIINDYKRFNKDNKRISLKYFIWACKNRSNKKDKSKIKFKDMKECFYYSINPFDFIKSFGKLNRTILIIDSVKVVMMEPISNNYFEGYHLIIKDNYYHSIPCSYIKIKDSIVTTKDEILGKDSRVIKLLSQSMNNGTELMITARPLKEGYKWKNMKRGKMLQIINVQEPSGSRKLDPPELFV